MRYQFSGTVKVFNGRYWKDHPVRTKGTKLQHAAKDMIQFVLKTHYPGKRISEVSISLQRLGPVIDVGSTVEDEQKPVLVSAQED